MEERDRGVIQVQMLGGFSLTWEGREYILGRNSSAKYLQLLQLVWLQGEKGISKEQILQALYDRETLSNSSNSLSNLIYQLRRQMVRAGLPQGEYISRKEGATGFRRIWSFRSTRWSLSVLRQRERPWGLEATGKGRWAA